MKIRKLILILFLTFITFNNVYAADLKIKGVSTINIHKTITLKTNLKDGSKCNWSLKSLDGGQAWIKVGENRNQLSFKGSNINVMGTTKGNIRVKVVCNKKEATKLITVANFKKYNLKKEKLIKIAAIAMAEQGNNINGVKAEVSLMCNRADAGANGKNPYQVSQSSWFDSSSHNIAENVTKVGQKVGNRGILTKKIFKAVKDVVKNGNRTTLAVEHDSFPDITYIKVNGVKMTSQSDIKNRNNYIEYKTIIHNANGAEYTFLGFPCNRCDPFGKRLK